MSSRKESVMHRSYMSGVVVLMLLIVGMGQAQNDAGQAPDQAQPSQDTTQQSPPPTAFGQEPPQPQVSKFPPLSGLDEASLEPNIAPRSFILGGLQAAEAIDSNGTNSLNRPGHRNPFNASTRLNGMLGIQRLWSRYQLLAEYTGGGALYFGSNRINTQMHRIDLDSRILWRTGQLQIRDAASYLPEGAFGGGSFGGVGGAGGGLGGGVVGGAGGGGGQFNFFGAGTFGSLGTFPRLMNLTIMDVQQSLSPRATMTLSGGYNLIHYTQNTGGLLVDSRQVTAQAGYNYALSRRNSLAVAYGFQEFHFPTIGGGGFETHVVHVLFGHQISGRLDLLLGAGPQYTILSSPFTGSTKRLSASARASIRYRFPRSSVSLSYYRYNSACSGFLAGAESDVVRLTVTRPFGHRWNASADTGFSHNRRLQTVSAGVNTASLNDYYAGARVNRLLTRSTNAFLFYQFNDLNFGSSFCGPGGVCNHLSTRNVIGLGLAWTPRPMRID